LFIQGHERSFVQGFYESEGYVGIHRKSGRLYIQISNTRREALSLIQDILYKWNIESKIYSLNENEYFRLTVWGDERVKEFLRITKPALKRSRIELGQGVNKRDANK
jgi:intein/homing endonuclease